MRISWVVCAVALTVVFALPAAAPAQSKKAQPDPFFTGPPFSMDDILQRLGVIADKRLATAIERRGVSFSPSVSDYDRLRKAGASGELLNAIQAKAPPPPPAPPPPAPKPKSEPAHAGPLNLACAPADCEVAVNGKPRGRTIDGKLTLRDLPSGEAVVDFSKQGFESQQVTIALHAGAPAGRSVTLKPSAATQAQMGKQLLQKMAERLGGSDAFQQASLLTASGDASLWIGGQRTDWKVSAKLKLPDMALVEISGARETWWTSVKGTDSKAGGTRRMAGGPVALEMEKLARLYRDYQLAVLAPRLTRTNVTVPAGAMSAEGTWLLRAAGPDGTYQFTLDRDATPLQIVYESPSGLGSGLTVLYADYATIQKAVYPKSMTFKYAGEAQHGLELRLGTVEFVAKLTDKELHR